MEVTLFQKNILQENKIKVDFIHLFYHYSVMIKSNLHTHSTFCDGKDTISGMVEKAISLGFSSIGFSSHAYTGLKEDPCGMKKDDFDDYLFQIEKEKIKHNGEIEIYKGLEIEAEFPFVTDKLDYAILSSHFVDTPEGRLPIDYNGATLEKILHLLGEKEFLNTYYNNLIRSTQNDVDYQIVGHFDLYTKFDEKDGIVFSEPDVVFDTAKYLNEKDKIFEINTGVIARGYRKKFYPSITILKYLKDIGAHITISSDCHNKDFLDCYFEETRTILSAMGFKSQCILTENGFKETAL